MLQGDVGDGAFEGFFGFVAEPEGEFALGHLTHPVGEIFLEAIVARVRDELVEVVRDGTDVLGDAPLVVVENADEAFRRVRNVV